MEISFGTPSREVDVYSESEPSPLNASGSALQNVSNLPKDVSKRQFRVPSPPSAHGSFENLSPVQVAASDSPVPSGTSADDSRVELITSLLAKVDLNGSGEFESVDDMSAEALKNVSLEDIIQRVGAGISAVAAEVERQVDEDAAADECETGDHDDANNSDDSSVLFIGSPFCRPEEAAYDDRILDDREQDDEAGEVQSTDALLAQQPMETEALVPSSNGDSFLSDRVEIVEQFECTNCGQQSELTVKADCVGGGYFDDESAELMIVPTIAPPHSSGSSSDAKKTDLTVQARRSFAKTQEQNAALFQKYQQQIATLRQLALTQQVAMEECAKIAMPTRRLVGFGALSGAFGFLFAILAFLTCCL